MSHPRGVRAFVRPQTRLGRRLFNRHVVCSLGIGVADHGAESRRQGAERRSASRRQGARAPGQSDRPRRHVSMARRAGRPGHDDVCRRRRRDRAGSRRRLENAAHRQQRPRSGGVRGRPGIGRKRRADIQEGRGAVRPRIRPSRGAADARLGQPAGVRHVEGQGDRRRGRARMAGRFDSRPRWSGCGLPPEHTRRSNRVARRLLREGDAERWTAATPEDRRPQPRDVLREPPDARQRGGRAQPLVSGGAGVRVVRPWADKGLYGRRADERRRRLDVRARSGVGQRPELCVSLLSHNDRDPGIRFRRERQLPDRGWPGLPRLSPPRCTRTSPVATACTTSTSRSSGRAAMRTIRATRSTAAHGDPGGSGGARGSAWDATSA